MSRFFTLFTVFCGGLYLFTLLSGSFPQWFQFTGPEHMLLGMVTAILVVCLHCLIFAIFTGAGKDTRLLSEDLKLSPEYLKRAKQFKRVVFPPALYAIFVVILTTSIGGFASSQAGRSWFFWLHGGLGWLGFLYNVKVFLVEVKGVRENSVLIEDVNRAAALVKPTVIETADEVNPGAIEKFEWGTHVYALGRFLTFMSYNTWLPYIYLRFIVGRLTTPFFPFLVVSLVFLGSGAVLRYRYRSFRTKFSPIAS